MERDPVKKHPLDMTNILRGHTRIPIANRIARLGALLDGDEAMADMTGWLIERRIQGQPPSWFAIGLCEPWTTTALAALRFARFVDARDYIAEHMKGDSSVEPTEHVWLTDKKPARDNRGERDFAELLYALGDWPKLPSPYILAQLGCALHPADHPDDWERGKAIQRELPMGRVPYTHECEVGAGLWDRITNGAWRNCPHEDGPSTATHKEDDAHG